MTIERIKKAKSKTVILYIDTTDNQKISLALEIDGRKYKTTKVINTWTSQLLLPLIREVLKEHKMTVQDINAVRINPGPGSFTGIRVGLAVANALGFLLDIPVNGKKGKRVLPVYQ